ncbi:sulfotransferase domain-containing protein [Alteromonas sp. ZYF713]|nr:sulfotransferase domain-containing protein [Alteromonas sp. ZYF713]
MSKYLLLGGTGKAGTTSLFYYLAQHPNIAPSLTKEPGFFVDAEYPYQGPCPLSKGFEVYKSLFDINDEKQVGLEASTQYIHCASSPDLIKEYLKNDVKLIFVFRNPIDYLLSNFNYLKQIGEISADYNFSKYIDSLLSSLNESKNELAPNALRQCFYSDFLYRYFRLFGKNNIHVIIFEDLKRNPSKVTQDVIEFVGLDTKCCADFSYLARNETKNNVAGGRIKNKLKRFVLDRVFDRPILHTRLKSLYFFFDSILSKFLSKKINLATRDDLGKDQYDYLIAMYRLEIQKFQDLIGRKVNWFDFEKGLESGNSNNSCT